MRFEQDHFEGLCSLQILVWLVILEKTFEERCYYLRNHSVGVPQEEQVQSFLLSCCLMKGQVFQVNVLIRVLQYCHFPGEKGSTGTSAAGRTGNVAAIMCSQTIQQEQTQAIPDIAESALKNDAPLERAFKQPETGKILTSQLKAVCHCNLQVIKPT